jgi:L-lactate utilization protein LutB
LIYKLFAFAANRPTLWNFGKKIARIFQPLQNLVKGKKIDPAKSWTQTRDLPKIAP